MIAFSNKPLTNITQQFPIEEHTPTDPGRNGRKTQTASNEYTIERVVSQKDSENDLRYRVLWYRYTPEHDTLEPVDHFPQHFIHCY